MLRFGGAEVCKTLLSVGTNHALLGIRNMVFRKGGYEVIVAKTGATALEAIRSQQLRAVVLGHSLSRSLQQRVTVAAKSKLLPVIVLHVNPFEEEIQQADANLCGIDGAARILKVLAELLDKPQEPSPPIKPEPRKNFAQAVQPEVVRLPFPRQQISDAGARAGCFSPPHQHPTTEIVVSPNRRYTHI